MARFRPIPGECGRPAAVTYMERVGETDFKTPLEDRLAGTRRGLERLHARLRDQCPGEHGTGPSGTGAYGRRALARLQPTLRVRCPGEHWYVQHGDGQPPWCDACGVTNIGLPSSLYEPEEPG